MKTKSANAVSPIKRSSVLSSRLIDRLMQLALFIMLIPCFVPFTPRMPASSLDSSWALALNQAVAQGFSFGKQIIFTLGPYASIYTSVYHPATDLMMMWGSFYLACTYYGALLLILSKMLWYWRCALVVCLLSLVYSRDALFFSYPLLFGLISFRIVYQEYEGQLYKHKYWVLAVLLMPLGLLPLVKGSLLLLSVAVVLLCALLFVLYRQIGCALLCLWVPWASLCFFWLIAGQSFMDIPAYIMSSMAIASDFTQAMFNQGNNYEVIGYLIASVALFLALACSKKIPGFLRLFLLCLFFTLLFLSFKAGFTRHLGHALIPGTSLLIAALLVPYCVDSTAVRTAVLLSIVASIYINGQHAGFSLLNNMYSTYSAAWHGLWSRVQDKHWARTNFNTTMAFLRNKAHFPVLRGSVDLYSYEQNMLLASGNLWSPRPVFQSYSVFNSALAQANAQHLLAADSPEYLFFKIEPLDNRVPSLEDGASWPILMSHYRPAGWANDFLLLHKNTHPAVQHLRSLLKASPLLGERLSVPDTEAVLFVTLKVKPTWWGRLVIFFFKPQELGLLVELKDGSKEYHRLVASMAESGFLLSPWVEQTTEFALLYQKPQCLAAKKVKAFTVLAAANTWQWNYQYEVDISAVVSRSRLS